MASTLALQAVVADIVYTLFLPEKTENVSKTCEIKSKKSENRKCGLRERALQAAAPPDISKHNVSEWYIPMLGSEGDVHGRDRW